MEKTFRWLWLTLAVLVTGVILLGTLGGPINTPFTWMWLPLLVFAMLNTWDRKTKVLTISRFAVGCLMLVAWVYGVLFMLK